MDSIIKKIKILTNKYRVAIFIFIVVFAFSFFKNYETNREKFDTSKFKNLAKYNEQLLDDAVEAEKFSEGEVDEYSSKRDTSLLDTKDIIPESESERALLIAMQEGKKLNEEHMVYEKTMTEKVKHINPDDFVLPKNLHSLDKLNNTKQQLNILKSATIEYGTQYQKLTKKYEQSIIDKINNPKYSDIIITGYRKSLNYNMDVQKAYIEHYEATIKLINFCIKAVQVDGVQYVAEEDNIAFATDELINKYNELIQTYNNTVIASSDAQEKMTQYYEDLNQRSAATFK